MERISWIEQTTNEQIYVSSYKCIAITHLNLFTTLYLLLFTIQLVYTFSIHNILLYISLTYFLIFKLFSLFFQ